MAIKNNEKMIEEQQLKSVFLVLEFKRTEEECKLLCVENEPLRESTKEITKKEDDDRPWGGGTLADREIQAVEVQFAGLGMTAAQSSRHNAGRRCMD